VQRAEILVRQQGQFARETIPVGLRDVGKRATSSRISGDTATGGRGDE
jgi:hypothetical protein